MSQIGFISVRSPQGQDLTAVDLPSLVGARRLPMSLRVVLENVARGAVAGRASQKDVATVAAWRPGAAEIAVPLSVTRVMMPDSSGLPALLDLAAARDLAVTLGRTPSDVEPLVPVTLVVDHSLIVDVAGHPNAQARNIEAEYRRNSERYAFFKWAQQAFDKLRIVPPGKGIIHQVHLESLAQVVARHEVPGVGEVAAPEFVLACDSHTTMVNGLGLLAWGVGGIEAEAAMLGESYQVRIPRIVGVRLTGALPAGATTTDLVLTVTSRLREVGVVGAFVEFFGPGLRDMTVPERATVANMAPEYGATVGYFPMDAQSMDYLRLSGRSASHVDYVEAYARATGLFVTPETPDPEFSETVEIDLSAIAPTLSGPKRPQDNVPLTGMKPAFRRALTDAPEKGGFGVAPGNLDLSVPVTLDSGPANLRHGAISIAAITSCTNTSNPSVMIAAGLLARNAVSRGLRVPGWVKTSLAPGSLLVRDYLDDAGLMSPLEALGFHIVGYGCTTCSGKSGPVSPEIARAAAETDLVLASVLSGNRNFEGRIHKSTRANYLASPPLVVAYALAGTVDIDFEDEPIGQDAEGAPVMLRDIWPTAAEIADLVGTSQSPERFRESYRTLFDGAALWSDLDAPRGQCFVWDPASTYVRRPPFFELPPTINGDRIDGVRVLVRAGDSLTTDHITPSGEILPDTPGGRFLAQGGVAQKDFNAVTQRRGNHDFMARVTFANQRMKNLLAPGTEGGVTCVAQGEAPIAIFEAAERFAAADCPVMVLAGKDYGMGSSRDWAAKGPRLLGVRLVLARSFERIHRANLIGMGIFPLVFEDGQDAETLGLSGFESFTFCGIEQALARGAAITVEAGGTRFSARIDATSAQELGLLRTGGIFEGLKRRLATADPPR